MRHLIFLAAFAALMAIPWGAHASISYSDEPSASIGLNDDISIGASAELDLRTMLLNQPAFNGWLHASLPGASAAVPMQNHYHQYGEKSGEVAQLLRSIRAWGYPSALKLNTMDNAGQPPHFDLGFEEVPQPRCCSVTFGLLASMIYGDEWLAGYHRVATSAL